MMIRAIKKFLVLLTVLIGAQHAVSQCDENVWNDSWTSCNLSPSPNTGRGESHWLLYEFDKPQRIKDIHIWNANKAGESNLGVKDATIDYSIDGSSWTELGSYTFPKADESEDYKGFDGPSLEGVAVMKVLFTFNSNYDTSNSGCLAIAEINFEKGEEPESTLVHIRKRNAPDFAMEGNDGSSNEQNVYLGTADVDNINQQWLEIDRGDGYYSYQKFDTNLCLDGSEGGANGQNVLLGSCNDNDQNQHWQKVDVGENSFKLIKRNASSYAVDGGEGGAISQNIDLDDASNTSQNLHWTITLLDGSSEEIDPETNEEIISIFPNPAVSQISFQGIANAGVNVYDISGKLVLKSIISSETDSIDVSALPSGIYMVTMQTESEIFIKKLVKQ